MSDAELKWELVTTNKQHTAAMRVLAEIASDLADMSDAAKTLGKPEQADLFWRMHTRLCSAHESASAAFSRELRDHYQTTVQGTANMIGACMAIDAKRAAPSNDGLPNTGSTHRE